jgi:hypothetical protein
VSVGGGIGAFLITQYWPHDILDPGESLHATFYGYDATSVPFAERDFFGPLLATDVFGVMPYAEWADLSGYLVLTMHGETDLRWIRYGTVLAGPIDSGGTTPSRFEDIF